MTDVLNYIEALGCNDGVNQQITKHIYSELIEAKSEGKLGENLNILYLKTTKTCYIEYRENGKPLEVYIPIYYDAKIDLHEVNKIRDELNYSEGYDLILAICDSNLTILYYEFNNFDINEL